ncbi:MAG: hypothetical protein U5Q16_06335 [Gammaproteobacteria bacterium]|nr:hypothetical protein [Gammaproteobacteria bacterium]
MSALRDQVYGSYRDWSAVSAGLIEEAREVFPGGDTLVDFMNNFTSLIHGHADPAIVAAVPIDASIPDSVLRDTVVCPYNQPDIAEHLIETHADELAAVIVEPVGGSRELLRVFHPDEEQPVMHASTFSGNPLSMAAGHAAMQQVDPQILARLSALGERFRDGVNRVFQDNALRELRPGIERERPALLV